MLNNFKKIYKVLDSNKKKQFNLLILLMFFAAIFETVGIGSMLPLITYFTNENFLISSNIYSNFFSDTSSLEGQKLLNIILISILVIYLIKNFYMILYGWLESKFAYEVRFNLGVRLFKKYLNNKYLFHIENNSSILMHKIMTETSFYGNALISLSALITESLIMFSIICFLIFIKPLETLIIVGIGFFLSLVFYFAIKNLVSKLGKKREFAQKSTMKSLNQGLGAIKDVMIYKVQDHFIKTFDTNSSNSANASYKMYFLQKLPRIWFEIMTISIITFVIFFLSLKAIETSSIMATIGVFLIATIRIIPSINRILNSIQSIRFSRPAIDNISGDLENNKDTQNQIPDDKKKLYSFKSDITFKNVTFKYPNTEKNTLDKLNFSIKKNQFVGIIGETGAGKSTLVDLLMGLLKPEKGEITLDKKNINESLTSWRNKLGYVPQNLYLIDDTIKKNIAFGLDDNSISEDKVINAVNKSQLKKFVNNLEKGVNSIVGERGIKISGGERQRIGIARALYNDPEIIIFDEATSALDIETEKKLFDILLELKKTKTIIFITHRTANLNICDQIFKLEKNTIKENLNLND